MAFQSICPTVSLEDPKADYKTAKRIEQFRASTQAIYMAAFPGTRYLPFRAVRQAWSQDTSITVTGTCGKSLPMVVVRMKFEGGFYHNFMFEKQKAADELLSILRENWPEVLLEREVKQKEA